MISYEPFWKTLKAKGITTYTLIYKEKISGETISRMKNNKPLTTTTLDDLCKLLNCELHEIAIYKPDKNI